MNFPAALVEAFFGGPQIWVHLASSGGRLAFEPEEAYFFKAILHPSPHGNPPIVVWNRKGYPKTLKLNKPME
jgi:hypothetical protein